MKKMAQRNFGDLPKAHNLEAADNGTKSHTFRLKRAIYTIPAARTTGLLIPSPGWDKRSGSQGLHWIWLSVLLLP